jgi:hypothetical protein
MESSSFGKEVVLKGNKTTTSPKQTKAAKRSPETEIFSCDFLHYENSLLFARMIE